MQLERELRVERAGAGRASAKARSRTDVAKLENARILYEHSEKATAEACAIASVDRRTFFAYLTARRRPSG